MTDGTELVRYVERFASLVESDRYWVLYLREIHADYFEPSRRMELACFDNYSAAAEYMTGDVEALCHFAANNGVEWSSEDEELLRGWATETRALVRQDPPILAKIDLRSGIGYAEYSINILAEGPWDQFYEVARRKVYELALKELDADERHLQTALHDLQDRPSSGDAHSTRALFKCIHFIAESLASRVGSILDET